MKPGGIGGGKVIEEDLKALGIEQRQLEKEALAGQRFHDPIEIEILKTVGRGQERVHPTGGDAAAHEGEQATARFVLGPEAPLRVALLLSTGYACLDVRAESCLKGDDVLKLFFGCERRGALSLAWSLYRTRACTVL
jgi:hypothetical protein